MADKIPEIEFDHYGKFPAALWRWKNFTPRELACKGDGRLMIHFATLDKLQRLRDRLDRPIVILSAYRTRAHNDAVGGAAGSMHLAARAFDVRMSGHDPHEFEKSARACGFTGFGFYPSQGFMHIDTGPARWWGTRWPAYEDETPAPAPLAGVLATPERKAEIAAQLGEIFGPKVSHPLKRKRAA